MAIPESADFIAGEAERRVREEDQEQHQRLVTDLVDPTDRAAVRETAERQVETALGQMPKWVAGAMEVPRGENAARTEEDVGEAPKDFSKQ